MAAVTPTTPYQVIARKWRPQTFEDLVGQGHVARTLQNALASGRLGHAFLFTGPRGVGKTSAARILAKALNCEQGPGPTPCNRCASCEAISAGRSVDVAEIDGASNNSVDEVRELRENVKYLPAASRFKVYIVDEVHMLSTAAFNALLKTLEEPPEHVKFVFATTEVQKVPATILSRCQRFDFRRIGLDLVAARLRQIADAEGVAASERALMLIARQGEGSMRDAQSLLDQVIAYAGPSGVTDQAVQEILGISDRRAVAGLAAAVLARDAGAALKQLDALYRGGADLRQLARDLLEHFRHLLVARVAGPEALSAELTPDEAAAAAAQAAPLSPAELQVLVGLLVRGEEELARAPAPRLSLEVTLIRMSQVADLRPLGEILDELSALGARLGDGGTPGGGSGPGPGQRGRAGEPGGGGAGRSGPGPADRPGRRAASEPPPRAPARRAPAGVRPAAPAAAAGPGAEPGTTGEPRRPPPALEAPPPRARGLGDPGAWAAAVALVTDRKPALGAILEEALLLEVEADSVTLGLPPGNPFHEDTLAEAAASGLLGDLLEQATGRRYRVRVGTVSADTTPVVPSLAESGAVQARRQEEALKAEAMAHPVVQAAAELFEVDIEALDVRPLAS